MIANENLEVNSIEFFLESSKQTITETNWTTGKVFEFIYSFIFSIIATGLLKYTC